MQKRLYQGERIQKSAYQGGRGRLNRAILSRFWGQGLAESYPAKRGKKGAAWRHHDRQEERGGGKGSQLFEILGKERGSLSELASIRERE